jgi:hypothetical protein
MAQKLTRPRRPAPAEVLRRTQKKLRDAAPEGLIGLRLAIGSPLVVEPGDALLGEVVRGAHDRGARDVQLLGDLGAGLAQPEPGHDVKPQRRREIAALASEVQQMTTLRSAQSG